MLAGRTPLWLAALTLLALAPRVSATTVVQPTLDTLVGSADYVVRGVVRSIDSEWRDNPKKPGQRYIASKVRIDVQETIKGQPPSPLVLDIVGGRVGDDVLTIDGAPQFVVGQESILFVRNNGTSFFPLVGFMHGYFPVKRDRQAGTEEVRNHDGKAVYTNQDIAPTPNVARVPAAANTKAMTTKVFAEEIQRKQKELSRGRTP